MRGLSTADMDRFTYGQLVNYLYEYERAKARARGEQVPDPEAQYKQLKAIEPIVLDRLKRGEITQGEYDAFAGSLRDWEEG